jgi:hypothetical protein
MRTLVTTLIAASVLVTFVAPEGAYARRDKSRKKHVTYQKRYAPRAAVSDGSGQTTQVQYDLNTLPFGSKLWWEQYLRTSGGAGGGGDGAGGGH